MAKNTIKPEDLFESQWHELRTELTSWDDYADCYEGLTRFWCKEAVFEVYWVAELKEDAGFELYLTEDLELAGFESRLNIQPSLEWKGKLAEALCWREIATAVVTKATVLPGNV